jgi:hypothetical protein
VSSTRRGRLSAAAVPERTLCRKTAAAHTTARLRSGAGQETRLTEHPDGSPTGAGADQPAGMPRWVKVLAGVVLLLVALVLVLHLTGNGPGPGSHLGSAAVGPPWS